MEHTNVMAEAKKKKKIMGANGNTVLRWGYHVMSAQIPLAKAGLRPSLTSVEQRMYIFHKGSWQVT